jgi:23S rRNA (guanosine2251-2'-O)-methyltransferase
VSRFKTGGENRPTASPRDRYITVYGRKPVFEALQDPSLELAAVMIADNASGAIVDKIISAARARRVEVRVLPPTRIKFLAGNGKQDQGVIADVAVARMGRLDDFLQSLGTAPCTLFLLDGVTNPSNVGLILRSATAADIDGVILPRVATPHVGPLVIKASAGVAFSAPILHTARAADAAGLLRHHGFIRYGLAADGPESIFHTQLARRAVLVLGGETHGLTVPIDHRLRIPMRNGVESLNVAVAASVVAFELARRREATAGDGRGHGPGGSRRTGDPGRRPAQSSTIDSQRR